MTIEFEKHDILNRLTQKGVIKPGQAVILKPAGLISAEVHIHALDEDRVEVIYERPGKGKGEIEITDSKILTGDEINQSRNSYSWLGGMRVSWRPGEPQH